MANERFTILKSIVEGLPGRKKQAHPEFRDTFLALYAQELANIATNPDAQKWYLDNQAISMWSVELICAATSLAALIEGPILEIGTYIGGGTVAFGRGLKVSGQRIICMEKGGAHPGHSRIPSNDILGDLKGNIARFGVADTVTIIEGNFGEDVHLQRLARELGGERLGLLCVDADGHVDRAVNYFAKHLSDFSVLLVDDYGSPTHRDKSTLTKPTIDCLVRLGLLEEWGVIRGETWIGRMVGQDRFVSENLFVTRLLGEDEIEGEMGKLFVARLPDRFNRLSDMATDDKSPLLLLENGRLLGPQHYAHDKIRAEGGGSYSHWDKNLWFSTSDGSDPRTNGRRYEVLLGHERLVMIFA